MKQGNYYYGECKIGKQGNNPMLCDIYMAEREIEIYLLDKEIERLKKEGNK